MAAAFYDLSVPFTGSHSPAAAAPRLSVAARLFSLGYAGCAYDRPLRGIVADSDRLSHSLTLPLPSPPHPSCDLHRRRLGFDEAAGFAQYSRVTVTVDTASAAAAIGGGPGSIVRTYDIVAARPRTVEAFDHLCKHGEVDMISLDFSQKLPFRFKFCSVNIAMKRGLFFEIVYSPFLSDGGTKRQVLADAKLLVDWTRGKNLIVSSAASSAYDIRGPYDVANLFVYILGLSMERAKAALSMNCRSLISKALRKKFFHKETIRVERLLPEEARNFENFKFSDWIAWDPFSNDEHPPLEHKAQFSLSKEKPMSSHIVDSNALSPLSCDMTVCADPENIEPAPDAMESKNTASAVIDNPMRDDKGTITLIPASPETQCTENTMVHSHMIEYADVGIPDAVGAYSPHTVAKVVNIDTGSELQGLQTNLIASSTRAFSPGLPAAVLNGYVESNNDAMEVDQLLYECTPSATKGAIESADANIVPRVDSNNTKMCDVPLKECDDRMPCADTHFGLEDHRYNSAVAGSLPRSPEERQLSNNNSVCDDLSEDNVVKSERLKENKNTVQQDELVPPSEVIPSQDKLLELEALPGQILNEYNEAASGDNLPPSIEDISCDNGISDSRLDAHDSEGISKMMGSVSTEENVFSSVSVPSNSLDSKHANLSDDTVMVPIEMTENAIPERVSHILDDKPPMVVAKDAPCSIISESLYLVDSAKSNCASVPTLEKSSSETGYVLNSGEKGDRYSCRRKGRTVLRILSHRMQCRSFFRRMLFKRTQKRTSKKIMSY